MIIIIKCEGSMEQRKRHSEKRDAILQAIVRTKCHPSAEWVYQEVKDLYPQISLGTVYRNLTQLKEEGKIIPVGVINGQERFDAEVNPHPHFVCRSCGSVLDLNGVAADPSLSEKIMKQYQVRVEQQKLMFYGLCGQCLEND